MTLQVGDKAPDFDLATDKKPVSLAGLKGKSVVLFFYPKDDTPTCTNEAIAFSAAVKDFKQAGAVVIGVSKDTAASHAKFRAKHELTVELGADTEGKAVEAYDVWQLKTLYGREYMGIERSTFLIDGEGVVRGVWSKVRVKGHVEAVLAAAKAL